MRKQIMGGCIVVGLLAGCGGAAVEEPTDSSSIGARQDAVAYCSGDFKIVYYSDASKTVEVGSTTCYCHAPVIVRGHQTPYWSELYNESC
ncbi:hypothetical protein JGU66_01695 [Myxococcaceae bacterium JPH2]|nr:hypothetical protein [Myxococcaceae bacterium JPH2]